LAAELLAGLMFAAERSLQCYFGGAAIVKVDVLASVSVPDRSPEIAAEAAIFEFLCWAGLSR
jgi:hypothetical protein